MYSFCTFCHPQPPTNVLGNGLQKCDPWLCVTHYSMLLTSSQLCALEWWFLKDIKNSSSDFV